MSRDPIPQTDSIQQLAEFWDRHEVTDYEDELEEVTEPVFEREVIIQLSLPDEDARQVEELAKAQGLDTAQLVRHWVHERVHAG